MAEKELSEFQLKELIKEEIAKTTKLIEMYTEETKPVAPDCAVDMLSRNDTMNNMSRVNALLRQAKAKLTALEFTLTKVGTEEFGRCVACRKEIPIGRILARPQSLYCIECTE